MKAIHKMVNDQYNDTKMSPLMFFWYMFQKLGDLVVDYNEQDKSILFLNETQVVTLYYGKDDDTWHTKL